MTKEQRLKLLKATLLEIKTVLKSVTADPETFTLVDKLEAAVNAIKLEAASGIDYKKECEFLKAQNQQLISELQIQAAMIESLQETLARYQQNEIKKSHPSNFSSQHPTREEILAELEKCNFIVRGIVDF